MCAVPLKREEEKEEEGGERQKEDPHWAARGVALPPPRNESRRDLYILRGRVVGAGAKAGAGVSCCRVRAVAGES